MPGFFFNVQQDEEYVEDVEGKDFPDRKHALEEALVSAREVAAEGALEGVDRKGWYFKVTDARGQTALTVGFAAAIQEKPEVDDVYRLVRGSDRPSDF